MGAPGDVTATIDDVTSDDVGPGTGDELAERGTVPLETDETMGVEPDTTDDATDATREPEYLPAVGSA